MILLIASITLTIASEFLFSGLFFSQSSQKRLYHKFFFVFLGIDFLVGVESLLFLVWLIAFGSASSLFILVEIALFALLLYFYRKKTDCNPEETRDEKNSRKKISPFGLFLAASSLFFFLIAAIIFFSTAIKSPHGFGGDAWAVWNFKAKIIATSESEWHSALKNITGLSNHPGWSQDSYPLLLPLTIAKYWTYLGSQTVLVPIGIAFFFAFSVIALVFFGLASLRNSYAGFLAVIILLISPFLSAYGPFQYADIPFSFFLLTFFISLFLAFQQKKDNLGYFLSGGIALALSTWTKNEGFLIIFAVLLVSSVLIFFRKENKITLSRQQIFYFLFGFVPIILVVFYYKYALTLDASGYFSPSRIGDIFQKIGDSSRYIFILDSFKKISKTIIPITLPIAFVWSMLFATHIKRNTVQKILILLVASLLVFYNSLFIPLVFLLMLFFHALRVDQDFEKPLIIYFITLFLIFLGYCAIYLISPFPLKWHIDTSASRLVIQLLPVLLFGTMLFFPKNISYDEEKGQ